MISDDPISDIDRYPVAIMGKVGEFLQGVTRDGSPILYSATIISPELATRALGLPASSFRVFVENNRIGMRKKQNAQSGVCWHEDASSNRGILKSE